VSAQESFGTSRWGHWLAPGGQFYTAQQFLFGRELGDEEELCPVCREPLRYDWYDGPIRDCVPCGVYWVYDEYENGLPGVPFGTAR
jgi:hypothetical protein